MMKYFHCWMVLAYLVNTLLGQTENPPILDRFEWDEIVPYVLPRIPSEIAYVYYGRRKVNMGNIMAPSDVQRRPTVSYTAYPDKLYTLVMVDPDAPNRTNPIYREWLHWLVVNIPGNYVSEGETLAAYVRPDPPKDSGLHRYVFAVFQQPAKRITFGEIQLGTRQNSPRDRGRFSIRHFASNYHLGNALAGNYFLSEWDAETE